MVANYRHTRKIMNFNIHTSSIFILVFLFMIVSAGCTSIQNSGVDSTWISTPPMNSSTTLKQINASAGWLPRMDHSSVVMPDGSVVLMGGNYGGEANDTWRSTDYGATWTLMTAHAGWPARAYHSCVVIPDGSIILMGGGSNMNDTWRSTDYGATWTLMTASAGWSAREYHTSVVMPDGSIVLMGGRSLIRWTSGPNRFGIFYNDVWRSTDKGVTWTQINASAGWSPRWGHSSVVMPDSSIVLMGGEDGSFRNDVWRSTDNGLTWTQMNASAGWSPRIDHSSVVMPDGSIVLMGGADSNNDVWRSLDNGATWTQVTASAAWSGRYGHRGVVMPGGSIILMGGFNPTNRLMSDVWISTDKGATWILKNTST
jgi:hypothetical protein